MALNDASTQDMIDLAGIMGLHSMINQEQYHAAVTNKSDELDQDFGWDGVTKATPLKYFPPEEPNLTDPDEVLTKIVSQDDEQKEVNLNNVLVSEQTMIQIFEALADNEVLSSLSLANTCLTDWAAANLTRTLESNDTLEKLNLESNNKVEMAITKSIEQNKTLLKVGIQLEFNESRNRVAVHLQKNLDRIRLKRIAEKLANRGNVTAGYFAPPPGSLSVWKKASTPESEYEYYYSDDEE